ncbi:MAG: ribonuclease III [Lysobacterales bacterium]
MKDSVAGIRYRFRDGRLLEEALTHRSVGSVNNERLEFLGDSVLDAVVSAALYERFPKSNEGDLTRKRARLVRRSTLARLAGSLDLGRAVRMDSGVMKSGGFRNESILADAFEAVLGAIYLDGGYAACSEVILEHFMPLIDDLPAADDLKDPKTRLQEAMQAEDRPLPVYDLVSEQGPPHDKTFHVSCELEDGTRSEAEGSSRSAAEQAAAARVLESLEGVNR